MRRARGTHHREWLHTAATLVARAVSPWLTHPITGETLLGWPRNWRETDRDDDA